MVRKRKYLIILVVTAPHKSYHQQEQANQNGCEFCFSFHRRTFIFGSVARNENTEGSDIDIVVEVEKPSLQLMYELKEALKALFACEVDLVRFRDSLRPLFKSNILRDVIYV